jgi:hypothetical protein
MGCSVLEPKPKLIKMNNRRHPAANPRRKNFMLSIIWPISGYSEDRPGTMEYIESQTPVWVVVEYLIGKDLPSKYNKSCIFEGKKLYFDDEFRIF